MVMLAHVYSVQELVEQQRGNKTVDVVDAVPANFLQLCYFFGFASIFLLQFCICLPIFVSFCIFCRHFCVQVFQTQGCVDVILFLFASLLKDSLHCLGTWPGEVFQMA